MKQWQKDVLEMTKDEPIPSIFTEEVKNSLEQNGFKVKKLKKKKNENSVR
jgi:hypothetical protein